MAHFFFKKTILVMARSARSLAALNVVQKLVLFEKTASRKEQTCVVGSYIKKTV